MLYTSRPLERVYADLRRNDNTKEDKKEKQQNIMEEEYKEVSLPHGRVVTRRDGENYIVQKINSTDMTDYLNEEYSPGKAIN